MNYDNAIIHYEEAINILIINDSNDYDALITLNISIGNAHLKKSDFSKSIHHFLEALNISKNHLDAIDPRLGHIHCLLGEAYVFMGDFEKAFFCHQKELEAAIPLFEDIDLALIYWKLGNCCQQMNKYEMAISEYLEGFKKSNNKAGGFPFNIGNCFEAINKPKDAMEYYLIASEIRINELGLTAKETIQAVNNYNRLAIEFGDKYLNVNDYKPNR
jgi:tetratricopeptide (TPR) repeat protein